MTASRSSIRRGRIVFSWIEDRNGHGKLRPALIVTPDQSIAKDADLVVMAITTTFGDPPPPECVSLPWHPRGHPVTRLNRRSAAVVNWLAKIQPQDIAGFGGDVPERTMRIIGMKLNQL